MKYNIVELPIRTFMGVSKTLNINKPNDIRIGNIWDESMELSDKDNIDGNLPSIGLELYGPDFMSTREFLYCALLPIKSKDGIDPTLIKELPAGKYIRFETTFNELQQGVIPKVYEYIMKENIPVGNSFDYEEYPPGFNASDPNSKVYIVFKYFG